MVSLCFDTSLLCRTPRPDIFEEQFGLECRRLLRDEAAFVGLPPQTSETIPCAKRETTGCKSGFNTFWKILGLQMLIGSVHFGAVTWKIAKRRENAVFFPFRNNFTDQRR
jgi:hypothetical protein